MPIWTETMQQTFEFYKVNPGTWKDVELIKTVESGTIDWDLESNTLGSANFNIKESIGEVYVRTYLITVQNGVKEKHPLGTHIVQTPSVTFDGKIKSISMDAYTPLLELNEKKPPIGYFVQKDANIMNTVYIASRENMRAPVIKPSCTELLFSNFVADVEDTWLVFLKDLMTNSINKYSFNLDEMGCVLFMPKQDTASLQPVWTYDDGNSSILYPDITLSQDLYGIPNVVEVIFSNGTDYNGVNEDTYYARVINDDPNSPTSIQKRGREIVHRVTNPTLVGDPSEGRIQDYAEQLLRELSSLEYTITYSHGYCPVHIGDCVRLNYSRAGLTDIKAKVISQSIKLEPGCPVTEKAVFTKKLWR